MKPFGAIAENADARSRDLLRAYFQHLRECPRLRMPDVFRAVVRMPASRFFVSVPRAVEVVSALLRGDPLLHMRPNKRDMFLEIHRRVLLLRSRHPGWSLTRLVADVVSAPAPQFYLAPGSARVLILKARRQWFAAKKLSRTRTS